MKLSVFIVSHMPQILAEWEEYAKTMRPAADAMTVSALRDHAEQMLRAVALDIEQFQSPQDEVDKSKGLQDDTVGTAAAIHGAMRHASQFSLLQLSSEFRALRATVLRRWLPLTDLSVPSTLHAVVRFNEAIDQALAESIDTYSRRADETHDLLLGILGHDLRGPLATISVTAELLRLASPDQPADPEIAPRIKRAARFMSGMVEDMIGFTRTQLGNGTSITRQSLDIGTACEAAMDDAESMHPQCACELQTHGNLLGSYDAIRVHQLLVNVIGNACQHGARDQPVRVIARSVGDAVVVEVHNRGAAIPEESMERIFDPLVQISPDGAEPKSSSSLGLGLFVAREIAKAHGGSLTVRSDDAGTTFSVTLPRAASVEEPAG